MSHNTNETNNNNFTNQNLDKDYLKTYHMIIDTALRDKLSILKRIKNSCEEYQVYLNQEYTPLNSCNSLISTVESKLNRSAEEIRNLVQDNNNIDINKHIEELNRINANLSEKIDNKISSLSNDLNLFYNEYENALFDMNIKITDKGNFIQNTINKVLSKDPNNTTYIDNYNNLYNALQLWNEKFQKLGQPDGNFDITTKCLYAKKAYNNGKRILEKFDNYINRYNNYLIDYYNNQLNNQNRRPISMASTTSSLSSQELNYGSPSNMNSRQGL